MTEQDNIPLHQMGVADLESIPHQIGHAILRLSDGATVRPASGQMSQNDTNVLYKMLLEVGNITEEDPLDDMNGSGSELLRRINVKGDGVCYSMCISSDNLVYIVKKRSDP